ncbi:hypothetical protein GM692_05070 [Brucella abortus]|nr:hypothetical protein CJP69_15685 [Brucella abortus]ENS09608.1 hypothetical protein C980_02165 [Brucella abortus 88/217]ENS18711.1 hypothetical protein B982_02197 [Brucella abortus F10/06-3]EOQ37484.1 hypothetical protein B981_02176 [Brucella abortus 93/2]ERU19664.1 hypothetical protein P045_01895 [Brucella abortus 03-4923-239-D]
MSHLADLSAVELVSSYKAKALSPVEVTEAVIGRIEAYEPKLNALWAYDPEAARLAAKASEARWAKGEPAGPIDGVPLTIKENIATKGTPVPLGCAALPLKPAAADAPPAARTREAGACCLPRPPCPISACCRRACRVFTSWPAIRGILPPIPAVQALAREVPPPPVTARSISARILAAPSACLPAGAVWSA